jgi:ADP-heptose:LPS heptosyltransferase
MHTKRERCLVMDFHHLGDAVMCFPAVRGLQEKYDVFVACLPSSAPVFGLVLPSDRILPLEAPWGGNDRGSILDAVQWFFWIHTTARQLRPYHFAASFSGWCDPRVDLLASKAGIPMRAGLPAVSKNYYVWRAFHLPSRLSRIKLFQHLSQLISGQPLLTHPVIRDKYRQHHRDDWAQVMATAGVKPDNTMPWFEWSPTDNDRPESYWLLHPGSEQKIKRWEMSKWNQLRIDLEERVGMPVRVIQGPGESVSDLGAPVENVFKSESIDDLAGILAGAKGLVCLDSFPAHLAAAMGIPVIAIFGRQNPCWYSPYGAESLVVTVNDGRLDWGPPLLAEVTVEMVMKKIEETLKP